MKKIFTHLFTVLLLSFVTVSNVWAQETTTIEVTPSDGDYNTTGWCSSWASSSSAEYLVRISVGVNNLNASTESSGFQMARGLNADSDWTFSVDGYKVVSYSFKFKSAINNQDVTLSATNADGTTVSKTSSYSTEQTFSVDCSNASTATFRISGLNYSIIATDLTLTVRPVQALTSLEVGKVYRFVNVLYPTYSLNANSATDVNAVTTNETDTKQQWYVEKQDGEYYVLRNLAYGKYLKGEGQSTAWSMSDDYSHNYNKFKLYTSNTDYNTLHTNTLANYAYIHCNSSYNIVGWSNGATDKGSHWEITKVDYTAEEITALLEKAPTVAEVAAYPAALEAIFSDAACTILNSAYTTTSMTDEQLAADANYSALPQTLKNMVKKVRNDEWSETTIAPASRPNGNNNDNHNLWTVEDTWGHEYAKKFRVQMYEPYSVEGEITSFLGINAHCNMDNPTGIYANAGEPIYIMVEGDIAEGAELWVAHQTGHGVTNYYNNAAYTQLKKGLNVIPYASDGCQLWINYLVHTYNTSTGEFPHKLSDYKPLKIHIEGGHINGFFNAMGDFRAEDSGTENLWGEVDNDADWNYYKARVALATDFALLGHRQTLLFPFGTWNSSNGYFGVANENGGIEKALAWHLENIEVPTTPNCYVGSGTGFGNYSDTYYPGMQLNATTGKINIMLEAWDRIMYSEHATMGLLSKSNIDKMNDLYPGWASDGTPFDIYNYGSNDTGDTYKAFCEGRDYSDYYNHHGAAVGSGTGYMSGGWRACNYHYNTMGSIIGKIAVEAGPTWGPAHEIGHQHQKIFNLNGQTEVTNNFFSNVAVWYMGMGTSRVNGSEGSLASVLDAFNTEDNDLYTNNIWAITHLYYRLWLYYHLAGNNTQFWPRLFELLRQTPMVNGGQISGETSLLRFYQHACDAAGEDLTEFFRAHGFFELMTNRFVGDYSNATYNVTEEQIETAITAVKEKNYPVNYAVLLINDATSETTLKHDGTTKRALWDTNASAEYGSVTDFIEGNTSVTEAYTAIVGNDGTVTMSGGEGGVGFLVFNENGELVSFSNKSTFELSDEAKKTILQGNATFVAVDSENNTTTAEIDLTAMQRTILAELIAMAQQIVDKIDDTYTKIGFYKGAAAANLAAALENAKTVYDAGTSGYGAAYDLLYAEYQKVLENPDAKIPFDPSLTYIITNKAYTNQTMWVNNELVVRSEDGVDQAADAAKWQFKPTATNGVYNIYNKKGYYCPAVLQSTAMTATTTANADALYTLQEVETGVWAIKLSPAAGYRNFHSSWNNVVGWETGNNASRWYLTAVEPNATIADLTNLEVYITKTEALLGEVLGTVTYTKGENITLQTTTEGSAGYIWSNAPCATEGAITNLVDGAANNYFHTEWDGDAVTSGDHYIAVDLGAGNTLPRFAFSHTTRSGAQNDFPKSVDVYGSDDNVTYKYLGSASDMPQSAGTSWQFDGMIISSHRYLRFNMHANRGYWHMAEFDIMPVTSFTATVNDAYSATVNVATVTAAMEAMYNGKGVTLSMSPTKDNIDEKLEALRSAYDALYTEYSAAITERKNTLAQLAANTQNLINQVGTVGFGSNVTKLTLTNENLYCNAPYTAQNNTDYSADYVSKLTDNSATTFLHTDYSGTIAAPHYLRVYLGENSTVRSFMFNYTTRDNGNNCPTTILIEGCNEADGTYKEITTLTAAANGLPNPGQNTSGGVAASFESSVITMGAAYKYVRFKVTGVEGGGVTFFVMSEFGFSTVEDLIAVNSKYKSVVTEDLLLASVHTTNSSAAMSTNALVTSVPMLDAQIADQQAAYDKLNEAMQKATCDKSALEALINATEALKSQLYKHTYTQGSALALQADNAEQANYLYCNASESNSEYGTDNKGVAALLDSDETNYLHTEWNGDQSADGLDHYLRVDLGEDGKLSDFVFSYKSARDLPRTFVVEGCNTADGEYERIGLYVGANTTNTLITSGLLGNGNEYRYLRFRVIATQSNKKDNSGYHRFFVLNDFDVYPVSNIVATNELKDEYASAIYIYTTTELVTEVTDGIAQAQGVVDDASANQGTVNAEIESLQAVYDKLAEALRYANAPVEITTDEANPILYNIIIKRADDGSKVLQYCEFDAENPKTVSVSVKAANSSYQAWYFMESVNGYYFIKPFNGDGKVLGADNTGDGDTKVWAVAEDEKSYDEWNFVARADGYYNIQAYDCSNYFSNKGGVDFKMGFWSGSPESYEGSLFKFVKATFENDNARYYQLSDFENTLEYQTADIPDGEMVGAFVNGAAYSEAYTAASTLITAGNTSDAAECRDAYTALRIASDNLEENVIEEGKYYRIDITPGLTDGRAGASMCIGDNGKLAWGEFVDADARFYFTFEYDSDDNLYMKNLHTATYLDEALGNSTNTQVGADAETITDAGSNVVAKSVAINTLGTSGDAVVVGITPNGGAMLNCKLEEKIIVAYDNIAVDKASAWVITEVDEISGVMENVVHSVSLGADESGSGKAYSTLYLGYNATIPEGVTASVVTEINEIGQLVMEEVTGDILPAKTAVVLSGENADDAEFKYADGEPSFSTEDNILKGTSYTKLENCGNSHNIYMLGKKNGRVAFYRAYENRNASGDKVTVNGTTNHNESGYVKCNANKAYLMVPEENAQAAAAMFSFFMGGNTTDLESINAVADTYDNVYDLQGRKHTEITEPGMYIVGGKKVLVK